MPTVLVIEDHESVRTVFTVVLMNWGYSVITAESGERGLVIARRMVIDAACVDAGLPGMDGFIVCRELRNIGEAANRDLPVWMFTGAFSDDAKRRALAAGARGLWAKPFSWPELQMQLRRIAPAVLEPPIREETPA